jgi:hypothetical protein
MEDGDDAAVAITLSVPRKGTAKLLHHRAPLDVRLYQMIEDVEALLLSSTAGFGVVGNGGAVWWPAARVSTRTTKRRRKGILGFLRVFIRPLWSSVFVEVKNGGRDVALVVVVAVSCASKGGDEDEDVRLVFIRAKRYGLGLGCGLELDIGLLGGLQRGLPRPGEPGKSFFPLLFFFCFYFLFSILVLIQI